MTKKCNADNKEKPNTMGRNVIFQKVNVTEKSPELSN